MDNITINFKLLESSGISINEFLCLLKLHFNKQGDDINYIVDVKTYESLEKKQLIKIIIENGQNKIVLRESAKLILEASFNDLNTASVKKAKNVSVKQLQRLLKNRIIEYRSLFKGLKSGSMGSPEGCMNKLVRWLKNNPEYTFEDVIAATNLYIKRKNGDYTYLQRADYFIYKKVGKDETSTLSIFIEELAFADTYDKNQNWTSNIN